MALDLVRYANVEQKYHVKYWGIGNEAELYAENGLSGYTVDVFNQQWREWAVAMRKVDPSIVLVGPDVSQYKGDIGAETWLQDKTDWLTSFLRANGSMVGMVSIHRYPFPTNGLNPPTIPDLRNSVYEWDSTIPALRKLIHDQTGRDIPIAVTEINSSWNANSAGEATMDSHYNAIWWAAVLSRMIEGHVAMVDQFALAGDYGIVGPSGPRPMYYTYLMYRRLGSRLVKSVSDDPNVSIVAARAADGSLSLLVVNLASGPRTMPLTIVGGSGAGSARTWLFDSSHAAVEVSPASMGNPVTMPAESVTVFQVAGSAGRS